MYLILQAFANFAMAYGIILVVLAMIVWAYQSWHKKKHGPLPKGRMTMINVVIFILAAVISLPIAVSKTMRLKQKSAIHRLATNAQQQMQANRKRQEETLAHLKPAGTPEPRPQMTPVDEARRQQREVQQDADTARQQAAQRRQMEETRAMREADFYRPPSGSATAEQKALDAKIVTTNQELQDLKAQQQAYDEAYQDSVKEQKRLMSERPVDHERLREVSSTLHGSMRKKLRMSGPINETRREVTTLLRERQKLGE